MKILPTILIGLLGLSGSVPLVANTSGFGINSTPTGSIKSINNCPDIQKDSYGNCPYTGKSNFRYISTSGSGSTGGRSGGSGGGK